MAFRVLRASSVLYRSVTCIRKNPHGLSTLLLEREYAGKAKETRIPEGLKYTEKHEWLKVNGDVGTVGITDFAQNELGDVVYVELPEVGNEFSRGDNFAALESTKAATDVYAPVSGKVVEVNNATEESPSLVNNSPYDEGWLVKLQIQDKPEVDELLDSSAYEKHIESTVEEGDN